MDFMKLGICSVCGGIATQSCRTCGATVCIKCMTSTGCKICEGKKKVE
jgi:hypothetical protein